MKTPEKHVVLVVEDDADVRLSIAEVLADNDYEPVQVTNGQEALDELRRRPHRPCLILLDVMMPVMDGQQFRAAQLRDPELQSIPVIVLSAHNHLDDAAKSMGVLDYMHKPLDIDDLLDAVRRFCVPNA